MWKQKSLAYLFESLETQGQIQSFLFPSAAHFSSLLKKIVYLTTTEQSNAVHTNLSSVH